MKKGSVKPETGRKNPPAVSDEYKMLQELKRMNDTLIEIKDILNNIWRERRPE